MHLSVFGLQQVHRGEGPICSLSPQKGLAESWQSQWANMFMQSQPYWRELWVVCWRMRGKILQLLYFFHVCMLKVVTAAFLAACTVAFCPPETNRQCSYSPTASLCGPGWRGRVCPASCRTWVDKTNAMGHWRRKTAYWCSVMSSEKQVYCVLLNLWILKICSYCKTCYFSLLQSLDQTVVVFQYNIRQEFTSCNLYTLQVVFPLHKTSGILPPTTVYINFTFSPFYFHAIYI